MTPPDEHYLPPVAAGAQGYGDYRCAEAMKVDTWGCNCALCQLAFRCRELKKELHETEVRWARLVREGSS